MTPSTPRLASAIAKSMECDRDNATTHHKSAVKTPAAQRLRSTPRRQQELVVEFVNTLVQRQKRAS